MCGVVREFITWSLLAVARDIFALIGILIAMLAYERATLFNTLPCCR